MAKNYFGATDTGRVRDNNEDTFIAETIQDNGLALVSVIDGVGGYNGGEVAAAIARDTISEQLSRLHGDYVNAMAGALKLASKNIFERKQEDKELEGMACVVTIAIADIPNNVFYYAHVGDTRLYLLRDESLIKISKDHSFVGFLEDTGRLTETAAMNHPKRNEINKALGFTTQIDTDESFIETGQSPFLPGDILLLCSDGLTDMVDKNGITAIVTQNISLQDKANKLISAANANGGRDNVTVVLVQNNRLSQKPDVVKPSAIFKKSDTGKEGISENTGIGSESNIPGPQRAAGKRGNGLSIILAVLCLALVLLSGWFYLQWRKIGQVQKPVNTAKNAIPVRNADEIKLQNAIDNLKGDTLNLSDTSFKKAIIITDTLHIKNDTLYIRAKGNITLQRDTSYHGPALSIAAKCKFIVLDNINFEGFDAGISLFNTSLYLKNIKFINCRLAINKNYVLGDGKVINADLPFNKIQTDTIAKIVIKPNGTR